jgi:hypothetical protein
MFRSDTLDEITQPTPMSRRRRFNGSRSWLLITAAVLATTGGTAGAVAAHAAQTPNTPNRCVSTNAGDYTACNVGNSGSGDRPYRKVTTLLSRTSHCIRINGGDFTACNVKLGQLPNRPAH